MSTSSNYGSMEINYRTRYEGYNHDKSFQLMAKFEEGIAKYAEELLNNLNSESKDVKLMFTTIDDDNVID